MPDAVLISHAHYDHLDLPTVRRMRDWDTTFIVPLGVGAHLEYWGVPSERIVELDWWEHHLVGDVEVVAIPARHTSGRDMLDQAETLWVGFGLLGPERRVYFSGDTGMFSGFSEIGERLGPFDLTVLDAGVPVVTPRPGDTFDPLAPEPTSLVLAVRLQRHQPPQRG